MFNTLRLNKCLRKPCGHAALNSKKVFWVQGVSQEMIGTLMTKSDSSLKVKDHTFHKINLTTNHKAVNIQDSHSSRNLWSLFLSSHQEGKMFRILTESRPPSHRTFFTKMRGCNNLHYSKRQVTTKPSSNCNQILVAASQVIPMLFPQRVLALKLVYNLSYP